MTKLLELFGVSTSVRKHDWAKTVKRSWCPFLGRRCVKNRKSQPDILLGTCCVAYGKEGRGIVICPRRLLENKRVFTDCIHLLTSHEPGNEFHIIPEISIPGGSVDYFLTSVNRGKVRDFDGIELQTVDTTGTVWPERQRFLHQVNIRVDRADVECLDTFGMNWKMTAKTVLVQLHHKVKTLEAVNKHLVLVVQDLLLAYMRDNFVFQHIRDARVGDAMHFHAYSLSATDASTWTLELTSRLSTDSDGVAKSLGRNPPPAMLLSFVFAAPATDTDIACGVPA